MKYKIKNINLASSKLQELSKTVYINIAVLLSHTTLKILQDLIYLCLRWLTVFMSMVCL
jgi:hypothetical protein